MNPCSRSLMILLVITLVMTTHASLSEDADIDACWRRRSLALSTYNAEANSQAVIGG